MRRENVFYDGRPAGIITETDLGYEFAYDPEWLEPGRFVCY